MNRNKTGVRYLNVQYNVNPGKRVVACHLTFGLNLNRLPHIEMLKDNDEFIRLVENEFRVEESKRLINEDKSNNRTIDAIASEAGFTNRSSFYRVFKRSQGVSPTDYRMGVTRKD